MAKRFRRGWRHILMAGSLVACAATPCAADDVGLAAWAREAAAPKFLAALEAAGDDGSRNLGTLLRNALDTEGATHFPVHDARFWAAAVESRSATQAALAVRVLALAADGDSDAVAPYRELITRLPPDAGAATDPLADLLSHVLPHEVEQTTATTLELADAALDRGDFALAAIAYRLVLLDSPPEGYAFRDIAGHYFYCLHALGVSPDVQSARARFNTTVVFPSVETQSRARIAATDVPEPATTTAAVE